MAHYTIQHACFKQMAGLQWNAMPSEESLAAAGIQERGKQQNAGHGPLVPRPGLSPKLHGEPRARQDQRAIAILLHGVACLRRTFEVALEQAN